MLGYRTRACPTRRPTRTRSASPRADLDEAVGRLVAIIRRTNAAGDRHLRRRPDGLPASRPPPGARHHRCPPSSRPATPTGIPTPGEPWQPLKLYYTAWSRQRIVAMHEKLLELGIESPFDDEWFDAARRRTSRITTKIDIAGYVDVRREALLAHATQIDPNSPFWFGLPPEVVRHRPSVRRLRPRRESRVAGARGRRLGTGRRCTKRTSVDRGHGGRRPAMPKWLTQEWLDERPEAGRRPARAPGRVGPHAVRRHRRSRRRRPLLLGARERQAAREPARRRSTTPSSR